MSTYGVYSPDLIGIVWGLTHGRAAARAERMWPRRELTLLTIDEAYGDRMLKDGVDCVELAKEWRKRRPNRVASS